ncbi:MAG: sodium/solute symporter [Candidatus Marinimicrobia bacterium]|nr:sodium/solute symporter [Candidatus Neomarinimicrobiota bacterium]
MSWRLSKGQKNQVDYYVGGRKMKWWAIGVSTAATQTSAIGFMSVPAFVAMKQGGGMKLLQGEFILPIAMIFIMVFLIPFFRKLELISVYEYLEKRFDPSVKYLLSSMFLLSRGLATAIGFYMAGIVLSTVLKMPLWTTILLIGGITLIYDTLGGIKAVIYSDVLQMGILLMGAFLIAGYSIYEVGGFGLFKEIVATKMPARLQILDFRHTGLGDGVEFSFWPQVIGGFFLLSSYYGCDQTQTQRELSAATLTDTRNSLIFNGFFRFPLSLLYIFIGLSIGAYAIEHVQFTNLVHSMPKVDYMVPIFIMNNIPHGFKALIFVAVLAAAMSSLDSAINSLSAASMKDFIEPLVLKKKKYKISFLRLSKISTVTWGVIVTLLAFYVGNISGTVIESIGIVGSAFYGPILAAFLLGVGFKRTTARGVFIGVISGVLFNLVLHFWFQEIFWLWWNCFGCLVSIFVALFVSLFDKQPLYSKISKYIIWNTELLKGERAWIPKYLILVGYFFLMIVISWLIPKLF